MDDADIPSTTCDDVDEKFDIDDELCGHNWNVGDVVADDTRPAVGSERDKESVVTARKQARRNRCEDFGFG